jgi:MOSC domain-containing protein YiiM
MTPSGATLVSIQVGQPRALGADTAVDQFDKTWTTGIFKTTIEGPALVRATHIEGDAQADTENHGGIDKAICAFPADHYEHWRRVLGRHDFLHGAFGENFTIRRIDEDAVCIGDIYALGEVRLQVSQPRQPCWKLARKWRVKDLADQLIKSGHTGWYFRVLHEGVVARGTALELVERPHPDWTVSAANQVMHGRPIDKPASARLAGVGLLSESWKRKLRERGA